MKDVKVNDIFGTCTNKTEFSGDVNKALDAYSGSVKKVTSSVISNFVPNKVTDTVNSATKSVTDNVKKAATHAVKSYKSKTK